MIEIAFHRKVGHAENHNFRRLSQPPAESARSVTLLKLQVLPGSAGITGRAPRRTRLNRLREIPRWQGVPAHYEVGPQGRSPLRSSGGFASSVPAEDSEEFSCADFGRPAILEGRNDTHVLFHVRKEGMDGNNVFCETKPIPFECQAVVTNLQSIDCK